MPGVPSYRGCEACRRQKKKCDQARPACSRCARLKIPCIGCGQQRFKFKDETKALRAANAPPSDFAAAAAAASSPAPGIHGSPPPSRPLSNQTTRTSGAIVSVLQISDPRYDLFAFGPFIKDIPSRLGTHAALDASADALASAFSCVHTRCITPESLAKYARALRSVQNSLQSPATAYSEQTLCAIYFIMLCQGWIANDDNPFPGHGPAMAHLLNVIVSNNWHNAFNSAILITISVSVV
ncbi:fungal zn(2)-Cys(6) binuclear cluster domain-containing protein [Hirsutella rhossiliensis]|uniref:Fungal zn(2)-Cys(6) binuclear cluster domain-containing protein n=1 Tax=Hirsutella rhossiliensis TaxID=111463 RepID=A0A9P8MPX4_9HYPO|nr:fungal zn(2)-Cys(6) binuclear cluster domain-containing protein [Hirsutella rhossiliensis]KAH0960118.1 fungal zn(2)-Cys(6) binuclear cluster domain-containing protein [Hirsutella rhossiliensis]